MPEPETASGSRPLKLGGLSLLLSALFLLLLLATPCTDARADQAGEVDRTILDAMQKSYELEKTEKAKEKPVAVPASRPGAPNAGRPRAAPPGGFSATKTAQLVKTCGNWQDKAGAVREARALLDAGADPNGNDPTTGSTALISAARAGNTELMVLLLDCGADVNAAGGSGDTALIEAARAKEPEAVALLLDRGANVHAANNDGETALEAAVCTEFADERDKSADCVTLLLKLGASPNAANRIGTTALMSAALDGNTKTMALLLEFGANLNAARGDGMTALMLAATDGEADAVRLLLNRGAAMQDGFGHPFVVLPSEQGWLLSIGRLSERPGTDAVLFVYGPLLSQGFKPSDAWASFGGPMERLGGKPLRTEKTQGWIIADPLGFLKRLAQAGRRLVLRLDSLDGQRASADFPLAGAKPAISAALAVAERQRGFR